MNGRIALVAIIFVVSGASSAAAGLMTHVDVSQSGTDFTYTLFNDEPSTSSNYLSTWNLSVDAPFTVINTPAGWDYFTDNATYIDWFNTDPALPYPHDVAPGASLGGFEIESTVATSAMQFFDVGSWDHSLDAGGPDLQGSILSPVAGPVSTPEPSTLSICGIGLAGMGGFVGLRRKR